MPKPNTSPEFMAADMARDRNALVQLNIEYMAWALAEAESEFGIPAGNLLGMPLQDYVADAIDKIVLTTARAVFYLARFNGQLAGMGGLRPLDRGTAEIKRIYFRPEFRGLGLGARMLDRLLDDARLLGFRRVVLDSAPFMTTAHRLYASRGFVGCAPYEGVEAPPEFHDRWRFMALELAGA